MKLAVSKFREGFGNLSESHISDKEIEKTVLRKLGNKRYSRLKGGKISLSAWMTEWLSPLAYYLIISSATREVKSERGQEYNAFSTWSRPPIFWLLLLGVWVFVRRSIQATDGCSQCLLSRCRSLQSRESLHFCRSGFTRFLARLDRSSDCWCSRSKLSHSHAYQFPKTVDKGLRLNIVGL